uniref:Uncharacterized protein n=1 Tax=Romanomermis culicivorax TaxID=13658 RepID=A0A915KTV5_ROMCU
MNAIVDDPIETLSVGYGMQSAVENIQSEEQGACNDGRHWCEGPRPTRETCNDHHWCKAPGTTPFRNGQFLVLFIFYTPNKLFITIFKTSEKFGTSEYESFRQIVEKAKADFEFLGHTRSQTKLKVMPGNDDAEAKALEATVKRAMEEATKPIKNKLENLKLKIEETEGHNETNMRESFLHFNPFQMFNPPPPFSRNFDDALDKEMDNLCDTEIAFENLESRTNFVVDKDFDDSFALNLDDFVENYEKPEKMKMKRPMKLMIECCWATVVQNWPTANKLSIKMECYWVAVIKKWPTKNEFLLIMIQNSISIAALLPIFAGVFSNKVDAMKQFQLCGTSRTGHALEIPRNVVCHQSPMKNLCKPYRVN